MAKRKLAPRTRNAGTWTEAQFWSAVRSCWRLKFRHWKPVKGCIKTSYVKGKGYQCAGCSEFFRTQKEMQADHIVPCGSLKCEDDLVAFLRRLCPEGEEGEHGQALCRECHQAKTNREREERKAKK